MLGNGVFLIAFVVLLSCWENRVSTEARISREIQSHDTDVHEFRDNTLNVVGTDRNPLFQWLSGLLGITTTEKPTPLALTPPEKCPECKCGIINTKNRIVGGEETQVNQYPWMVLLMYSRRLYCGGTLISDRYVLTAAHCVSGFDKDRITVRLLEHDRSSTGGTPTITRNVIRIVKHACYSSSTYNNDIALLQLNEAVKFDSFMRPACLATPGRSFTGLNGIVTG